MMSKDFFLVFGYNKNKGVHVAPNRAVGHS